MNLKNIKKYDNKLKNKKEQVNESEKKIIEFLVPIIEKTKAITDILR
tara:strand:+ start:275 stop:415 length:141 start_codon:yes stop_codon:yes gene_type:complete